MRPQWFYRIVWSLAVWGWPASTVWSGSLCTGTPAAYVIVTSQAWQSAFDSYISTKNAQGLATRSFTVENITAQYAGADVQEKIRNFLIDAYQTWAISYVLLGGDEHQVPIRYIPATALIYDAYYFKLTGSGDDWGGVTVMGGRLPAVNSLQAQAIANRWARYPAVSAWNKKMLWCNWAGDQLTGLTKFTGTSLPDDNNHNEIKAAIHAGQGIVTYFAHGYTGGWTTAGFFYPDAQTLTNGDQIPYVIAAACSAGIIDADDNIVEAFFQSGQGGILAYAGANRELYASDGQSFVASSFNQFKHAYFGNGRVRPAAMYYLAANPRYFNYYGDPTAEMDYRQPGDTLAPVISAATAAPNTLTAFQCVTLATEITDNDEVSSHVWAVITGPDTAQQTVNLTRAGYTSGFSAQVTATGKAGTYTVDLHAADISGNEAVSPAITGFTVYADLTPPVVQSLDCTPTAVSCGDPVEILMNATDDSGSVVMVDIRIRRPNGQWVHQSAQVGSICWITDTQLQGYYDVSVRFYDLAGNTSADQAIVHFPPAHAFRVDADTEAPVIRQGWITESSAMPSGPGDHLLSVTNTGAAFCVWIDAADNVTDPGFLHCWAKVQAPDRTLSTIDPLMYAGPGVYPPGTGYRGFSTAIQPGYYTLTVFAADQTGRSASAPGGRLSVFRAPGALTANPGNAKIDLAWDPALSGNTITGYHIFRDTFSGFGNTIPLNAVPAASPWYHDEGLINGTTYYYRVSAVDALGNTCGFSEVVAGTPTLADVPPLPPRQVQAVGGPLRVSLTWLPGVAGSRPIAGYQIYRGVSPAAQSTIPVNASRVTGTTYADLSVAANVHYYYHVQAEDEGGTLSPASNETHAQALPAPTFTPTPTPGVTDTSVPSSTPSPTPSPTSSPTPSPTPSHTFAFIPTDRVMAYPNPGRGRIWFVFPPVQAQRVKIEIFNLAGERVAVLSQDRPDLNRLAWDVGHVGVGIYYYQVVITRNDGEKRSGWRKVGVLGP